MLDRGSNDALEGNRTRGSTPYHPSGERTPLTRAKHQGEDFSEEFESFVESDSKPENPHFNFLGGESKIRPNRRKKQRLLECYSRQLPSLSEIVSGSPEDFDDPNDSVGLNFHRTAEKNRVLLPVLQGRGRSGFNSRAGTKPNRASLERMIPKLSSFASDRQPHCRRPSQKD